MKYQFTIVLAFSTLAFSGYVSADDDSSRVKSIAQDVEANSLAIDANTTAIEDNASAISANAGNIAANAAGVQANANAIAAIPAPTTYDFHAFNATSNVISKTFSLTGLGGCGNTELREYSFSANASDPTATDMTIKRTRSINGFICQISDFIYTSSATQRLLVGGNNYDPTNGTFVASKTPASSIVLATSSMAEGSTVADGTTVVTEVSPAYGGNVDTSVFVQSTTVVGLQNVSVPAGNFSGCLKTVTLRHSSTFGEFHLTSWSCPGVGEVKRIQVNTYPTGSGTARRRHQIWEMTNIVSVP